MTNTQLWIAVTIPSLLVVLSWIQQTTRMTRLGARGGELRREMVALRTDINRDMVALRDSIHRDMIGLHERVAGVEAKQQ